ncbi:MAG: polysaccharide biosynthesis C-terminal domain-containing protein [Myxococcota bacterium]
MRRSAREFAGTAGGVLSVQVAAMALALGLQLAFARWLGVVELGVFAVVTSSVALATNLLVAGLPRAHLLLTPAYGARGEWDALKGFVRWAYRAVLVVNVPIAAVAALGVAFALGPRSPWLVACVLVPVACFVTVQQAHLQAWRRVVASRVTVDVVRPLVAIAVVGVFATVSASPPDATVAVAAMTVAMATLVPVHAAIARGAAPEPLAHAVAADRVAEWRATAAQFFGHGVANVVLQQADVVLVGALAGARPAALYAIATRVGRLLLFALGAVNTAAAPMISSLHAGSRRDEVQAILRLGALANLGVCVVGGGGLYVAAPLVLSLFGASFTEAAPALRILLAGYVVNAACGSIGLVVNLTGNQGVSLRILGVAAAANVLLDLLVIPRFGIEGAAAVSALVMSAWNVAMVVWCRRALGYDPTVLAVVRRA